MRTIYFFAAIRKLKKIQDKKYVPKILYTDKVTFHVIECLWSNIRHIWIRAEYARLGQIILGTLWNWTKYGQSKTSTNVHKARNSLDRTRTV